MARDKPITPEFETKLPGYELLGRGPSLGARGWSVSGEYLYRCVVCGDSMPADFPDCWKCSCGAMHLDIGYGRFGSLHGDCNVLVYRRVVVDEPNHP